MKSEWAGLGLSKPILQTLKELKFSKMTPVQVKIPFFSQFLRFLHFVIFKPLNDWNNVQGCFITIFWCQSFQRSLMKQYFILDDAFLEQTKLKVEVLMKKVLVFLFEVDNFQGWWRFWWQNESTLYNLYMVNDLAL